MRPHGVAIAMIVALVAPRACLSSSVNVAASIFPISSMVEEIGGEKVRVASIVRPGSDPHHFELTPTLAKALYEADIVFLIGGHFDRWVLPATRHKIRPSIIEFHKMLGDSLIDIGDSFNPHFWLDPVLAKHMARAISMALCTVDSSNCDYYAVRTGAFLSRLDSLHASLKHRLGRSGFENFVSFHPSWSYFARRYGLREIDTIELSPEQEPSAKSIAEVIKRMKENQVKFILAEEFSNFTLARGVAAETGAEIIVLDPLGREDKPKRDSYLSLMDYNTSVIEEKLAASKKRQW